MSDDTSAETVLGRLLAFARQAGAKQESDTSRDGAFSHHAETHAFGVGFGVGAAATATGDARYVGAVVAIAFGANRGATLSDSKITEDVREEPHYALAGVGLGLLAGVQVGGGLPAGMV